MFHAMAVSSGLALRAALLAAAVSAPAPWSLDETADNWELQAIAPAEFPRDAAAVAAMKERHDPHAEFTLAYLYATNYGSAVGVPANEQDALTWATLAARAGDPGGEYLVGRYHARRGTPADQQQALRFFRSAAAHGLAAASFALGEVALRGADRASAESWFRKAATAGDAPAQLALYRLASDRRDTTALGWLRRAAEQNYPPAEAALGDQFAGRHGGKPNWASAVKWYRLAATQGDAGGLRGLAGCYLQGHEVPRDAQYAMRLLERGATDQNSKMALAAELLEGKALPRDRTQVNELLYTLNAPFDPALCLRLGEAFLHGGTAADTLSAARWLAMATFSGQPEAGARLKAALARLSPSDRAKAFGEVDKGYVLGRPDAGKPKLAWAMRAADWGLVAGEFELALIYEREPGVTPDPKKSAYWLHRAAEHGDKTAQQDEAEAGLYGDHAEAWLPTLEHLAEHNVALMDKLAALYQSPPPAKIKPNQARAFYWYRRAAEAGSTGAMENLAYWYEVGRYVHVDPAESRRWLQKAADKGEYFAMYSLSQDYRRGFGGPVDLPRAHAWLEKAAWAGDLEAWRQLSTDYEFGVGGVSKDTSPALYWLRAGTEGFDPYACRRMGELSEAGTYVPRSLSEAYKWYRLAKNFQSSRVGVELDRLTARISPTELAQGRHLLATWVIAHYGRWQLQTLYPEAFAEFGLKVPQPGSNNQLSEEEKRHELEVFAACGNPSSMNTLGVAYLSGDQRPKDAKLAEKWLSEAAAAGESWAMHTLSDAFARGEVLPKDVAKGYTWWLIWHERTENANSPYSALKELTPTQRSACQQWAEMWLQLHPRYPHTQGAISD